MTMPVGEVTDATAVLRGASVSVDVRKVGRAIAAACLASSVVLSAALFLAGVRKNDRIDRLRREGVSVTVTVSGCRGLMGGSGSNLVGYECRGSFSLAGHRYDVTVPGGDAHATGSRVQAVALPDDPTVLSTPDAVAVQRPSAGVFIAPAALLFALLVAAFARAASAPARRRRRVALVRATS